MHTCTYTYVQTHMNIHVLQADTHANTRYITCRQTYMHTFDTVHVHIHLPLQYATLHYIMYITLGLIAVRYIELHYITLHHIILDCIALNYATYACIHVNM